MQTQVQKVTKVNTKEISHIRKNSKIQIAVYTKETTEKAR